MTEVTQAWPKTTKWGGIKDHFDKVDYYRAGNLVLWARSELTGFAGKIVSYLGVLEYWSTGVLEKANSRSSI
jgi:hypothetical protein